MFHDPSGLSAQSVFTFISIFRGVSNAGIDLNRRSSGAGGIFSSDNAAAIDFARTTNGRSIENDWEYGAFIYSWEESITVLGMEFTSTLFSYTEPHVDPVVSRRRNYVCMENPTNPHGTQLVALAHTHAAWGVGRYNDGFSDDNKAVARGHELPIYVATPSGSLRRYSPNGGNASERIIRRNFNWSIPHDSNHRNLTRFHNPWCGRCH
jgi:hypothetical protein